MCSAPPRSCPAARSVRHRIWKEVPRSRRAAHGKISQRRQAAIALLERIIKMRREPNRSAARRQIDASTGEALDPLLGIDPFFTDPNDSGTFSRAARREHVKSQFLRSLCQVLCYFFQ